MADARTEEMERTFGMDLSPQREAHLQALIDAHHLGADLAHCAIDGCSAAWPCGPRFNAEHELYTIGVMRSITGDHPVKIHLDIVVWLRSEIARRSAVEPDADGYTQVQASIPGLLRRLGVAEEILVNEVRPHLPRVGYVAAP